MIFAVLDVTGKDNLYHDDCESELAAVLRRFAPYRLRSQL
jgi:hypothetical protein